MENKRDEFRRVMREWLPTIQNKPDNEIEKDVQYTWGEWGIQFKGMERFGETLTLGGDWESEGMAIEVNINPNVPDTEFRVLFRWR
jgi:hypothetical protein